MTHLTVRITTLHFLARGPSFKRKPLCHCRVQFLSSSVPSMSVSSNVCSGAAFLVNPACPRLAVRTCPSQKIGPGVDFGLGVGALALRGPVSHSELTTQPTHMELLVNILRLLANLPNSNHFSKHTSFWNSFGTGDGGGDGFNCNQAASGPPLTTTSRRCTLTLQRGRFGDATGPNASERCPEVWTYHSSVEQNRMDPLQTIFSQ